MRRNMSSRNSRTAGLPTARAPHGSFPDDASKITSSVIMERIPATSWPFRGPRGPLGVRSRLGARDVLLLELLEVGDTRHHVMALGRVTDLRLLEASRSRSSTPSRSAGAST